MKVLCAGLSKTGTSSVTQALKELGINVLHFEEYFGTTSGMRFDDSSKKVTLDLRPFFEDLVHGRLQDPDFESSLASVEGGLSDIPAAYYFEEIAAAFPECKIILTQRKEQEWYASMRNHVQEVERLRWLSWLVPEARKGFAFFDREHSLVYGGLHYQCDNYNMLAKYRQHNARVKATISKDRLLVWNVGDGWEPICTFLGKPVPEVDFPHANSKEDLRQVVTEINQREKRSVCNIL